MPSQFRIPCPGNDALSALADRWRDASPKELANAQSYIIELCEALGVERPRPSGSGYEFELGIAVVHRDGTESAKRADLLERDHFLLDAKDEGEHSDESGELRLRRAFGQASSYAAFVPGGPPPFLLVLDTRLHERPEDVAFLRAVRETPASLDPNRRAAEVTKEIAGKLAKLASRLEAGGGDNERVARFLIRCVFTRWIATRWASCSRSSHSAIAFPDMADHTRNSRGGEWLRSPSSEPAGV